MLHVSLRVTVSVSGDDTVFNADHNVLAEILFHFQFNVDDVVDKLSIAQPNIQLRLCMFQRNRR